MIPLLLFAALAQAPPQKPPAEDPGFVIRTETNLAMVRFHVVRKNKYVEQLRPEDIELREDGQPQKVALFEGPSTGRTVPLEVILLFDVSLSISQVDLLAGVQDTILKGIGEHVTVSVYAFANRLRRFTPPTRDIAKIKAALDGAMDYAHGGTRLYEAIMATAADASRAGSRPATRLMIVFSDGLATSKTKSEDAVKIARAHGIPLYPVVLGHLRVIQQGQVSGRPGFENPRALERQARAMDKEWQMREFADTAAPTGGRSFDPPLLNEMVVREILKSVVRDVQTEYIAGYYPASGETRRTHKVEVVLRDKNAGKIYGGVRTVVH